MGTEHVVVVAQMGAHPHRDRLFAAVHVQGALDRSETGLAKGLFLEQTDAPHIGVELAAELGGESHGTSCGAVDLWCIGAGHSSRRGGSSMPTTGSRLHSGRVAQARKQGRVVRHQVVVGAAGDILLQTVPLDSFKLSRREALEHFRHPHLGDRVGGALRKRDPPCGLRLHEVLEKVLGLPRDRGGFEHRCDLGEHDPSPASDRAGSRRDGTDLRVPGEARRRGGVDPAAHVEVDGAVHQCPIQLVVVVGDDGGAAKPSPRGGVEARFLVLAKRREGIESSSDAYVKEVEVLVEQDSVVARGLLVGKLEALILGARAVDSLRVDHEVEGAETLADADEVPFGVPCPGVETLESGQHALEVRLEARRVERTHETGRVERAANPGVVDVQHVARGAPCEKVFRGAGIGEQGARADAGRATAFETIQHARRVVPFPAEELDHLANLSGTSLPLCRIRRHESIRARAVCGRVHSR